MRLFIVALILSAFFQSAFLPLNLCLCLVISRSFVSESKSNLIAAFFGGILLGFLNGQNIGFWALVFLILAKIIYVSKNLPFAQSPKVILPLAFLLIVGVEQIERVFLGIEFNLIRSIIETLLCIPLYIAIRFWEERFVMRGDVRLKLKK